MASSTRTLRLIPILSRTHPHLPHPSRQPFHTTYHPQKDPNPFNPYSGPSPPRLPKEDQEIFESLQRQSTGAFSSPSPSQRMPPKINQSPDSSPSETRAAESEIARRAEALADSGQGDSVIAGDVEKFGRVVEARGGGEELHPNVRRGAEPEFEGEVNPKTGEVGGPKNEPLRWGAAGDWSYNGRTTDF